jgi:hypothetical protein
MLIAEGDLSGEISLGNDNPVLLLLLARGLSIGNESAAGAEFRETHRNHRLIVSSSASCALAAEIVYGNSLYSLGTNLVNVHSRFQARYLERCRAPFDERHEAVALQRVDRSVNLIGLNISTIEQAAAHVDSLARITHHHLPFERKRVR